MAGERVVIMQPVVQAAPAMSRLGCFTAGVFTGAGLIIASAGGAAAGLGSPVLGAALAGGGGTALGGGLVGGLLGGCL